MTDAALEIQRVEYAYRRDVALRGVVVFVLVAACVSGVLAWLLAALASGVLSGQVRDAVDPANLRTT